MNVNPVSLFEHQAHIHPPRTGRLGTGRLGAGRLGAGRLGAGRLGTGRLGTGRLGTGRLAGRGAAGLAVSWLPCLRETRCGAPRAGCTRHWRGGC